MTPPPNARTTGTQFQGLVPVPIDPGIDPPPHACIQCWLFGHSGSTASLSQVSGALLLQLWLTRAWPPDLP